MKKTKKKKIQRLYFRAFLTNGGGVKDGKIFRYRTIDDIQKAKEKARKQFPGALLNLKVAE